MAVLHPPYGVQFSCRVLFSSLNGVSCVGWTALVLSEVLANAANEKIYTEQAKQLTTKAAGAESQKANV